MLVVFGVCRRQNLLDIANKGADFEKAVPCPPHTTGEWKGHMPIHFYDKFRKPIRTEYWTCKQDSDGKWAKISKKGVVEKRDAAPAGGAPGATP